MKEPGIPMWVMNGKSRDGRRNLEFHSLGYSDNRLTQAVTHSKREAD